MSALVREECTSGQMNLKNGETSICDEQCSCHPNMDTSGPHWNGSVHSLQIWVDRFQSATEKGWIWILLNTAHFRKEAVANHGGITWIFCLRMSSMIMWVLTQLLHLLSNDVLLHYNVSPHTYCCLRMFCFMIMWILTQLPQLLSKDILLHDNLSLYITAAALTQFENWDFTSDLKASSIQSWPPDLDPYHAVEPLWYANSST